MYTSFSEVTAALSKKLRDLKYSDGTIQKYEREWTRFENYLSKNNIEQYDMETVKDYFFSKYNVLFDATAKEHSRSMRQTMRALRTLIEKSWCNLSQSIRQGSLHPFRFSGTGS